MLCSDCSKLGLSLERFQFALDTASMTQEQGSSSPEYCHELKRKLKRNRSCQFCELIYKSIIARVAENIRNNVMQIWTPRNRVTRSIFQIILGVLVTFRVMYHDGGECRIEWVTEGTINRSKAGQKVVSTRDYVPGSRQRRIRISWGRPDQVHGSKNKEREELYLYPNLMPPDTGKNLLLNEETDPETDFLTQNSYRDVYAWIGSWIKLCEKKHQNAYRPTEVNDRKAFLDLVHKTWFWVVDVEKMCLSRLPLNDKHKPEAYVALSYVWGTNQGNNHKSYQPGVKEDHRTLQSNIIERTEGHGLIMEKLPLTIRDAIKLVQNLGQKPKVRFIWIDSLCILQDDNFESWTRNAEKMDLIFGNAHFTICAADGDSGAGLRAMNPEKRRPLMKAKVRNDLELSVSSSPERVIQRSRWSTRGWTFQERILSRRCVVFAGGRIYLQCRENNYDDSNMSWSSDWRKSPLCIVQKLQDRPIWFYMTCVELYTGRNLTQPTDILKAFNGVSKIIEEHMCAPFIFGLPSSHFDFALLWRPKSGKGRRWGDPQKGAEFPSWSWSGWQDTNPQKGSIAYYSFDILEGCLLDLHDWLLNRTWIVWYIRDVNGSLEPLWQGYTENYTERLDKVAERWRGYGNKWDPKIKEDKNDVSAYGREFHSFHNLDKFDPPLPRTKFTRTLPSNASGVCRSQMREQPYQPVLQFWTWKSKFYVVLNNDLPGPGVGLVRLSVLDKHQLWCGTVVVDESWANGHTDKLCEFIALSDARKFTHDECTSWTQPVPLNLEDIDWDLYHVMLVEYFEDRCVWERKGLGKILKARFETLDRSKWTEIVLQ